MDAPARTLTFEEHFTVAACSPIAVGTVASGLEAEAEVEASADEDELLSVTSILSLVSTRSLLT